MLKNQIKLNEADIPDKDLQALVSLVKNVYSFDFSNYTMASLKRRVSRIMHLQKLTFFELINALTNDPYFFQDFLNEITVNVTEMFRDPAFFKSVNENVVPYLGSYQHIKVWVAGCSTGEELYAYCITFSEHNLYNRSFFYGTDINNEVLETAREGIYNLQKIKQYSENFGATGSKNSLSDYYTAKYDAALLIRKLKKNVLFSMHNLVCDGPFNEFQLVSCRNVLIYFNAELQNEVIRLFHDSLATFGFLCLGSKEIIRDTTLAKNFKLIDKKNNIYQKIS